MKITYLGQELDINIEHELFTENVHGFKIDIEYTEDSWYPNKTCTIYNCTEFHWRYDEKNDLETEKNVAFESDIHSSGFTRKIYRIKSINIELAEKLYTDYYGNQS